MKIPFFSALLLMLGLSACVSNQPVQPSVDYSQSVNPFIGTDFTGNTYPGAQPAP